jgi:diacylglycerol kinase family enzyme
MWGIRSKFTPVTMACDAIIHGDTRMIDVAQCNDQIALLIVAVGFEQQMIEFANRDEKNNDGQGAYLKGFLNAVTSGEVLSLYVRFDDQEEQVIDTHSMVIANAAPFSTLLAQGSGEPDINDGKLDVTWIPEAELPGMHVLSLTELVLSGFTSEKIGGFTEHKQVESVQIHHPDGLKYVIDGELFEGERLQIKVKPDALSVMSPKEPDLADVTL